MDHDLMPRDAEITRQVIDDNDLTVQQVANRAGFEVSTIYRQLSGERTLHSGVIRAVFELTHDFRLIGLVCGCVPVLCQIQLSAATATTGPGASERATPRVPPIDQLLDETCAAIKHAANAVPYMGKIIKDGRVDESDRAAIDKFKKHSGDARRCLGLLEAALESHLQKGGRTT